MKIKRKVVSFLIMAMLLGTAAVSSKDCRVQAASVKKTRTVVLKEYKNALLKDKTVDEFCVVDVTGDKIPELITHGKMYDTNGNIYSYIDKKLKFIFSQEGLATFYPNKHTCMMSVFGDDETWYKFMEGEYKEVATYNEGDYTINGKKCAAKRYNQLTKKLKGKALKWLFVDNTKSNRKKIK